MKTLILYFLILVAVGEIAVLYIMHNSKPGEKVLAVATVVPSPTDTATPTPSPTPTAIPTLKPTPKPTPTPVPQPTFSSEQIYEFTNRFAGQYGVSPDVLRYIAICESGFRASAKNYVYVGLYQFNAATWKNLRIKMGEDPNPALRSNAEEAVQTAAYALSIGDKTIWPNCNP